MKTTSSTTGRKRSITLAAALAATVLASCTTVTVTEVPRGAVALPDGPRLQTPIALVLPRDLETSAWTLEISGNTLSIPVGDGLAANVEAVALAAFEDVAGPFVEGSPKVPLERAILSARLAGIARTQPRTIFLTQRTTVRIEWRLHSPDGRLIWAQTVSGTGEGELNDEGQTEQVREAFERVFPKSLELLRAAPAIARA